MGEGKGEGIVIVLLVEVEPQLTTIRWASMPKLHFGSSAQQTNSFYNRYLL